MPKRDPEGPLGAMTRARFAERVSPEPTSGCHLWTGAHSGRLGHGVMRIGQHNEYAHRIAWLFAGRTIPDGLWVLHKCDNPACVNPEHLFLGTARDNIQDASRKGRASGPRTLTLAEVEQIRERLAGGETPELIGPRFGVSTGAVRHIRRGSTWRNKGAHAPGRLA